MRPPLALATPVAARRRQPGAGHADAERPAVDVHLPEGEGLALCTEEVSGAQRDRPELKAALDYAREGDTLVVWRLDRMIRRRPEQPPAQQRRRRPQAPRPEQTRRGGRCRARPSYLTAAMTLDQALAFGIIIATIGLFVWGRLAYDLVALLALLAGVATGIVPAAKAFEGFSDDV